MRYMVKFHQNFTHLSFIHGTHYKNDVVVSDPMATQFPPISFFKNGTSNSQITVVGGNYYFAVPYTIVSSKSHMDSIRIMRWNDSMAGNPNNPSMRVPTLYSLNPQAFTPQLKANDRGLMILHGNYSYPLTWTGATWVDADGLVTTDRKIGVTADRPILDQNAVGFRYLDKTLRRWIVWDGSKWRDSDGAQCDSPRTGTFADRPTADNIYIGFNYFCTDKQTFEGKINGIELFHKGADIWVDALGRIMDDSVLPVPNDFPARLLVNTDNTTATKTRDELNALYPAAKRGAIKAFPNLTGGDLVALKLDDGSNGNWTYLNGGTNGTGVYFKTESDARYSTVIQDNELNVAQTSATLNLKYPAAANKTVVMAKNAGTGFTYTKLDGSWFSTPLTLV